VNIEYQTVAFKAGFPDLSDADLDALAADMAANGLQHPIEILPGGVILAGHHRGREEGRQEEPAADGRFVYAGNRLHDSIGLFAVGADGTLAHVDDEWTRGNYPRSFNFDPTGRFLYCCNQRGDNVVAFRVDSKTGRLSFTGHYTPVGNPSCIVFLDLAMVG